MNEFKTLMEIIRKVKAGQQDDSKDKKIEYLTKFANIIIPPIIRNIMNNPEGRIRFRREIEHLNSTDNLDNMKKLVEQFGNTESLTEFLVYLCEDKVRRFSIIIESDERDCQCKGE